MNPKTCYSLVEQYIQRLADSYTVEEFDEGCHIITHMRRPDGEAVEISVIPKSGLVRLTDDHTTADYLFLNGLKLDSNANLNSEARRIARARGVDFQRSELLIEVEPGREAEGMERLLNTIEAIHYFIYRRVHRRVRTFSQEVELYLAENEVDFKTEHHMSGSLLSVHTIPIYVNSDKNLALTPLSFSSTSGAIHELKGVAFTVADVQKAHPVKFHAVLDDRNPDCEKIWQDPTVNQLLGVMNSRLAWDNRRQLLALVR